jgi:hypothetical protein
MTTQFKYRGVLLAAVLMASAAGAACDLVTSDLRASAADEWKKTYPIAANGRVEISNVNGRIDVQPGEGATVEVRAERRARAASEALAKDKLQQVQIEEDVSPASVRIETKVPRSGGLFDGGGVEVHYFVRVPAGVEVRMKTVNGAIELTGLRGRVEAETTNGGVVGRGLSGPVVAETTNGGLDLDIDELAEDGVRLSCTNGGIKLRLPRTAKATIAAQIANGGIDFGDLPLQVVGRQSRRRLDAQLNGGGPKIEIDGTNGGISLIGK